MHIKIVCSGLKKHDDHSIKTIFVGNEQGSKAYRCYDPVTECVIISHDVVFNEVVTWGWCDTDTTSQVDDKPFTKEYDMEIIWDFIPRSPSPPPTALPTVEPMVMVAMQSEVNEEDLDAEHDDAPL
jgi:hypothetical protein